MLRWLKRLFCKLLFWRKRSRFGEWGSIGWTMEPVFKTMKPDATIGLWFEEGSNPSKAEG